MNSSSSQLSRIDHTAPHTLWPHPGYTILHIRHPDAPPPKMDGEGPLPIFYVMRPDETPVPLIPLDELPSWLRIGKWNWTDRSLYNRMALVRGWPIPREGEYHVVCQHSAATSDLLVDKDQQQRRDTSVVEMKKDPNHAESWDDGSWQLPPQALHDALKAAQGNLSQPQALYPRAMTPADYLSDTQSEQPLPPEYWQDPFVRMCFVQIPALYEINSNIAAVMPKTPPVEPSVSVSPTQAESPIWSPRAVSLSTSSDYSPVPSVSPVLPPSPPKTPSNDESYHGWSLETLLDSDSDQQTHFTSSGSLTPEEMNVALKQLKRTLGIPDLCQESEVESEDNPLPGDGQRKDFRTKRWRKYYPVRRRRRIRTQRRLRRASDAYKASRLIAKESSSTAGPADAPGPAAPPPEAPARQQTNAATKRQARRELLKMGRKREIAPGSRYWHMMMVPNWRSSVPKR